MIRWVRSLGIVLTQRCYVNAGGSLLSKERLFIRILARKDLLSLQDNAAGDRATLREKWIVEDHNLFYLCYSNNEAGLNRRQIKQLLSLAVETLKSGLEKEGWNKPYVVITQLPDAVGAIGLGEKRAVFPIMWRSVLSDAENLWYFIHEMTEYRLVTGMDDLPRWFWEGMAQIVAHLIVKEIDPHGAASIRDQYLVHGMALEENYFQWGKVWEPMESGRSMSVDTAITEILAVANQVHFTPEEKRNYARALEFFRVRIASLAEARSLLNRVQQLDARTTERLLEVMDSSDEHCR